MSNITTTEMLKMGIFNNICIYDECGKIGDFTLKLIKLTSDFLCTEHNDEIDYIFLDSDHWLFETPFSGDYRKLDGIAYSPYKNLTKEYLLLGGKFGRDKSKIAIFVGVKGNIVLGMY